MVRLRDGGREGGRKSPSQNAHHPELSKAYFHQATGAGRGKQPPTTLHGQQVLQGLPGLFPHTSLERTTGSLDALKGQHGCAVGWMEKWPPRNTPKCQGCEVSVPSPWEDMEPSGALHQKAPPGHLPLPGSPPGTSSSSGHFWFLISVPETPRNFAREEWRL